MNDWLKAMNPTSPIATEAQALKAARASAISIMIGVVVGLVSLAWTIANPQILENAVAQAGGDVGQAQLAAAGQVALYTAGFMVLLQVILGFFQWRRPGKIIAILFMVLIAYGLVSTLATPLLADTVPNMPHVPMWQIVLSIVVLIVQMVLHVAGLRGISQLDRIQMEQSR